MASIRWPRSTRGPTTEIHPARTPGDQKGRAVVKFAGLLGSETINGPPPAWNRLAQGDLGRDTGRLLPVAFAVGAAALLVSPASGTAQLVAKHEDSAMLRSSRRRRQPPTPPCSDRHREDSGRSSPSWKS